MARRGKNAAITAVVAAVLTMAGMTFAQQPPPRRPPRPPTPPASKEQAPPARSDSDVPQRTTATYADWVVQCDIRAGRTPEKICEMAQVTEVKGRNVPFSRVVVSLGQKGQPIKLAVEVPVNAAFSASVRIQISDSDAGVTAPFTYCIGVACMAEFELKEDVLRKFRAATGAGKVSFKDAAGRDVAIPLSFNGFSQAFDALAKE